VDNLIQRVRRSNFRGFIHPPDAMAAVVTRQGMKARYSSHGMSWNVVGFERETSAAA
jgi:magnesium-protoporphyrin O-methyltransferase